MIPDPELLSLAKVQPVVPHTDCPEPLGRRGRCSIPLNQAFSILKKGKMTCLDILFNLLPEAHKFMARLLIKIPAFRNKLNNYINLKSLAI